MSAYPIELKTNQIEKQRDAERYGYAPTSVKQVRLLNPLKFVNLSTTVCLVKLVTQVIIVGQ